MSKSSKELLKLSFSSVVKPIVSAEKDKYLSLASLEDLRAFIPKVDLEKNIDVVPVAFNACVVNRANKNGDAILTDTALEILGGFIHKPINLEHDRKKVIGTIVSASFSAFGSDEPLTEEEVKGTKKPFNITLGGYIWRTVSEDVADFVEECNDPSSKHYLQVSASWELGFFDWVIAETELDESNLENARFIEDEKEISELEGNLRAAKGNGRNKDGTKSICRVAVGKVIPFGVGFTENPAADVKGVAVPEELAQTEVEATAKGENKENGDKFSQTAETNVNKVSSIMKINDLKDITDESLKSIAASEITEFISNQLKQAEEKYLQEQNASKEAAEKSKLELETLKAENETNKTKLNEVNEKLEKLASEAKAKEEQDKFSARMTALNDKYNLDEEISKVLASDLQGMSDEAFEKYQKNLSVMLKGKEKKPATSTASTTAPAPENVLEAAVEAGKKEVPSVPATPAASKSPYDEYKEAFGEDGWEISTRRKK
jgi:hypothetical protein